MPPAQPTPIRRQEPDLARAVPDRSAPRIAAIAGLVCAVLGAAGLLWATSDLPLGSYVSEAGVPGMPRSALYRTGVWLTAAAIALLIWPAARTARMSAPALAAAAALTTVSGTVTCSPGCPLPPYETPQLRDLVHAGASVLALACAAGAILAFAMLPVDRTLRLVGVGGAAVTVPLLAAAGAALAFAGRGLLTGVLERVALVALCGWLIVTLGSHTRISVYR